MSKRSYSTDLSDAQWEILAPLIPPAKPGGHPRTSEMRGICNAIFYVLKTGCQWNLLPRDFPAPSTVYFYYRRWHKRGVWEQINHCLRNAVRQQRGKSIQPTAIAADSQSVKTAEKRGRSTALMVAKLSKDANAK
jgi:putative transposase